MFGQPVDKITVESPIVFGPMKSHGYFVGRRGGLEVMSDFDPIDMKYGMEVKNGV